MEKVGDMKFIDFEDVLDRRTVFLPHSLGISPVFNILLQKVFPNARFF